MKHEDSFFPENIICPVNDQVKDLNESELTQLQRVEKITYDQIQERSIDLYIELCEKENRDEAETAFFNAHKIAA